MMGRNTKTKRRGVSDEKWLMLAFSPARGFRPSKNGKSWWKLLATRDDAIAAKRMLVSMGIEYKCKKVIIRESALYIQRFDGQLPRISRTSGCTAAPRCHSNARRRGRGR